MRKFQTGKVVKAESFLGRDALVKELDLYIEMGQSVVLIAPRRFGKTSLMTKVIAERQSTHRAVAIDLMEVYNKRDLAELIISETYKIMGIHGVIAQLKDISIAFMQNLINHLARIKVSVDDISLELTGELLKSKDDDGLLDLALALPGKVASKMGIELIFALDEFGELDKFQSGNELLDKMRSVFQHEEHIVYLFAGSQYTLMQKIFVEKNSAFHKFAKVVDVPAMHGDEFEDLYKSVFYANGVSIPAGFAQDIERISSGIPYYMVRIAQQVLIDSKLRDIMNVSCFRVRRAALKVYEKESSYFTSELSKLRGKKYDINALEAIASSKSPTVALKELDVSRQNANKILKGLIAFGFIEKDPKYRIVDPFFSRYIRMLKR
ncbi:MAG: hypothetical protein U9Q62_04955 [Campylobacterota bacterium]|nr:hypothetical protein [Campylobacterota bacterium]